MPSDTISGKLIVVLVEPVVVGGKLAGKSAIVVTSVPSNFWLRAERQPRPTMVVGVGVRVTPAVAPKPHPCPVKVACVPSPGLKFGIGGRPRTKLALPYSICAPTPTLSQSLKR